MAKTVAEKAIAYITQAQRLLVFRHTQFPEAGIQVPGGTIRAGESAREAVLREAREETGLKGLEIRSFLGACEFDLSPYGQEGVQKRYYFHLEFHGEAPETWLHDEMDPSDGSPAPIEFEFFWAELPDGVPEMSGGQGEVLFALVRSVEG
jgi:ADP-ribose pyrophosphatase YjhB (NUDIX family)